MASLDNLFESIYQESKKHRKGDELLKNDFGETWKKVSHTNKVFKDFEKIVKKTYTLKSKITLEDIAKVDDSDRYIAVLSGGLNGKGKWIEYFKDLEKILKEYTGEAWLVDIINDCADDVFTVRLAIRNKKDKKEE